MERLYDRVRDLGLRGPKRAALVYRQINDEFAFEYRSNTKRLRCEPAAMPDRHMATLVLKPIATLAVALTFNTNWLG